MAVEIKNTIPGHDAQALSCTRHFFWPQITTLVFGILVTGVGIYLFYCKTSLKTAGYPTTFLGLYASLMGSIKCYLNGTLHPHQKEPKCLVSHWLYKIIPRNWNAIAWYRPWEYITWSLLGNDDDGIFGEEATSGTRWITQWGGAKDKHGSLQKIGEISFKRFARWTFRNPLHNFTFYVIGFAAWKNLPLHCIALATTQSFVCFERLRKRDIFPMGDHSGFYFGLHIFPVVSWRINISSNKRIEGYIGYRTRGNFGISVRVKRCDAIKKR